MKMRMNKVVRALGAITMAAAVIAATVLAPVGDGAKVHASFTAGSHTDRTKNVTIQPGASAVITWENDLNAGLPTQYDSISGNYNSVGITVNMATPDPSHLTINVPAGAASGTYTLVINITDQNGLNPATDTINITVPTTGGGGGAPTTPATPGAGNGSSTPVIGPHSHDDDTLEWNTVVEADETNGGYAELCCKVCGEVVDRKWVNAYYIYNINTVKKIEKAPLGATVLAETDRWVSFHKMVFDALAARPDVTLNVNYVYNHQKYAMTIPAGKSGLPGVLDENGYAGYRRICTIYPTTLR